MTRAHAGLDPLDVRRWLAATALLVILAVPLQSSAQSGDLARAQKLFEEGDKAEQAGDCLSALKSFQAAMAVVETPQLRLRAGRCEEKLEQLVEALRDYERAAVLAQNDPQVYGLARDQVKKLEPRVPKIVFELPAPAPPILSISVDGAVISDPSQGRLVNAGKHRVNASSPGYETFEQTLTVTVGGTMSARIVLVPIAPAPQLGPGPSSGSKSDPVPWVLVGGGAVFLGVAIGLGVKSLQLKNEGFDHCRGDGYHLVCDATVPEDSEEGMKVADIVSSQNLFLGLSLGASVIAAGLAGTGIALAATGKPSAPRAAAVPWISKGGGGVIVAGGF